MPGQQVLDLSREHVLAAGDDHVVVAAVDEQPPVGVEVADVAGGHEPAAAVLVAAAGVALEQHLRAHEDAPAGARRAARSPRSSRILTTVPRGGRPAVPGAARRSAGPATVAQATSVEP